MPAVSGRRGRIADLLPAGRSANRSEVLRSNLRLQRHGTTVPRGGDRPSQVDDQVQVLLRPDVTEEEMHVAFAALDRWRPIEGSHAAAMDKMQRLGAGAMELRRREYSQRTADDE